MKKDKKIILLEILFGILLGICSAFKLMTIFEAFIIILVTYAVIEILTELIAIKEYLKIIKRQYEIRHVNCRSTINADTEELADKIKDKLQEEIYNATKGVI